MALRSPERPRRRDATGALPTSERRQRPRRSSEVAGHRLGPARWTRSRAHAPWGVARGPKLGSDRHWLPGNRMRHGGGPRRDRGRPRRLGRSGRWRLGAVG